MFDIPALAPLVAEKLGGVPSIVITNFRWDDIYLPYADKIPKLAHFIKLHQDIYAKVILPTSHMWSLCVYIGVCDQ